MGKKKAFKGRGRGKALRAGRRRSSGRRHTKTRKKILNARRADATGKNIFKNLDMCAEFFNGYVDVPYLEDVAPEEIENVSDRYTPMFSSEREADSVLRIRKNTDFFVVALIEHKSYVEYNIFMQIFRYMVYIWEDYEKEMERKQKGITKQKDFRYPPIIPIVFYEGRGNWTAPRSFRQKIIGGEALGKYIPDFEYFLVPVCGFPQEELLEKEDGISLVMLIQQMQDAEGVKNFLRIPEERLAKMVAGEKEYTMQLIYDILLAELLCINVPVEEALDIASKVKEKKMGVLFANAEKMDIQLERRRTKEALEKLEKANRRLAWAEQRAAQADEKAAQADEKAAQADEKAVRTLIESLQETGSKKDHVRKILMEKMDLSKEDAEKKLALYWS